MNSTFGFLVANSDWWKSLPADVKSGLSEAIQRLIKEQRQEIVVDDEKVFDQIKAKGCQMTILSLAEQASWKVALQPVYTEFGPKIGSDLVKEAQKEGEGKGK
jgi:TRAP-type C4-dicarboxylate transport system substrate-binding protein